MIKFGISNLRRLKMVKPVDIRPITLLVGRNSSGKSSFLRSFPLFRQSLMTRTSSPILWYGDLVDFGSYQTSVTDGDEQGQISFTFEIDSLKIENSRARTSYFFEDDFYIKSAPRKATVLRNINHTIVIKPVGERTRLSSIKTHVGSLELSIDIEIDDSGKISRLEIDGHDILRISEPTRFAIASGSLIPDVTLVLQKERERSAVHWMPYDDIGIHANVRKYLRDKIDGRVKGHTISALTARLMSLGFPTREGIISSISNSESKKIGEYFSSMFNNNSQEKYKDLFLLLKSAAMPSLMQSVSVFLKSTLSSTLYIGPARARSERYYRYQDLAVSEIDPDGKNFPMFLNSLSQSQISGLSNWVEGLFGYGLSVSRRSGHISINLTDSKRTTNIVDVGYGVSQILPVLGQIWWARERLSRKEVKSPLSLLAIEQPELHLHPAHQALLADALVGEAGLKESGGGSDTRTHYLVETHSETLVNRLGELIAHKRLRADDVQILIFEPATTGDRITDVRAVEFDENGALQDWPYGFFQPTVG